MATMGKSSMTMGEAMSSDIPFLKKMKQKRKMKKAIKSQNEGKQSYKYQPVRRALKKIGSEIGEKVESLKAGRMQRKAMRIARREGASEVCEPGKKCKTTSPTITFKTN